MCGDGATLPFADGTFDSSLSLLVLHFVPEPDRAIEELVRVTRPGGLVGSAVWDAGGGVPINRIFCDTAAILTEQGAEFRDKTFGRPMTTPGELEAAWHRAGIGDVAATSLTIRMEFENFADYWAPYEGRDGPYARFASGLSESDRVQLRMHVEAAYLSGRADGPRSFAATAWAVHGRRH